MTDLTFTTGDIAAASAVLTASAEQLLQRGQALWPPETLSVPRLLKHYPQDTWRVAWQQGQAVATCCLLESDRLFWPHDPPGQALYLHKLGVHPRAQGHGLAQDMLCQAVQETRAAGRPLLKLDTAADRAKLRALYRDFGFQEIDEVQVGPYLVVRMQLRVFSPT